MPVFNSWGLWRMLTLSIAVSPLSFLTLILYNSSILYYLMSTIKLRNFCMNIRQALKQPFSTTKWQKGSTTSTVMPWLLADMSARPYCLKLFLALLALFFLCSVLSHRGRRKQSMSAGSQRVYRGLSDCFGHTQHFHHGFQGIHNDHLF